MSRLLKTRRGHDSEDDYSDSDNARYNTSNIDEGESIHSLSEVDESDFGYEDDSEEEDAEIETETDSEEEEGSEEEEQAMSLNTKVIQVDVPSQAITISESDNVVTADSNTSSQLEQAITHNNDTAAHMDSAVQTEETQVEENHTNNNDTTIPVEEIDYEATKEKRIQEHREYRRKLAEDPSFVPYVGLFWSHDDRYRDDAFSETRAANGQSSSDTSLPHFSSIQQSKGNPDRSMDPLMYKKWDHSGYEELCKIYEREEQIKKEAVENGEDVDMVSQRQNAEKERGNRGYQNKGQRYQHFNNNHRNRNHQQRPRKVGEEWPELSSDSTPIIIENHAWATATPELLHEHDKAPPPVLVNNNNTPVQKEKSELIDTSSTDNLQTVSAWGSVDRKEEIVPITESTEKCWGDVETSVATTGWGDATATSWNDTSEVKPSVEKPAEKPIESTSNISNWNTINKSTTKSWEAPVENTTISASVTQDAPGWGTVDQTAAKDNGWGAVDETITKDNGWSTSKATVDNNWSNTDSNLNKNEKVTNNSWNKTESSTESSTGKKWDKSKNTTGDNWNKTNNVTDNSWNKTEAATDNSWNKPETATDNGWNKKEVTTNVSWNKTNNVTYNSWNKAETATDDSWNKSKGEKEPVTTGTNNTTHLNQDTARWSNVDADNGWNSSKKQKEPVADQFQDAESEIGEPVIPTEEKASSSWAELSANAEPERSYEKRFPDTQTERPFYSRPKNNYEDRNNNRYHKQNYQHTRSPLYKSSQQQQDESWSSSIVQNKEWTDTTSDSQHEALKDNNASALPKVTGWGKIPVETAGSWDSSEKPIQVEESNEIPIVEDTNSIVSSTPIKSNSPVVVSEAPVVIEPSQDSTTGGWGAVPTQTSSSEWNESPTSTKTYAPAINEPAATSGWNKSSPAIKVSSTKNTFSSTSSELSSTEEPTSNFGWGSSARPASSFRKSTNMHSSSSGWATNNKDEQPSIKPRQNGWGNSDSSNWNADKKARNSRQSKEQQQTRKGRGYLSQRLETTTSTPSPPVEYGDSDSDVEIILEADEEPDWVKNEQILGMTAPGEDEDSVSEVQEELPKPRYNYTRNYEHNNTNYHNNSEISTSYRNYRKPKRNFDDNWRQRDDVSSDNENRSSTTMHYPQPHHHMNTYLPMIPNGPNGTPMYAMPYPMSISPSSPIVGSTSPINSIGGSDSSPHISHNNLKYYPPPPPHMMNVPPNGFQLPPGYEANGMVYYGMDPSAMYAPPPPPPPFYYYGPPMPNNGHNIIPPQQRLSPNNHNTNTTTNNNNIAADDLEDGWGPSPDVQEEEQWGSSHNKSSPNNNNNNYHHSSAYYLYPPSHQS